MGKSLHSITEKLMGISDNAPYCCNQLTNPPYKHNGNRLHGFGSMVSNVRIL